jgi:ribosomal protein S18 acetylase RimI-like enzyme
MEENNTTFVTLPKAPSLPGVCFRFFQTAEDYASITRLMNATWQADEVEFTTTAEGMAHLYAPQPTFEPARQLLLAERDGKVIALAQHRWMELRDGKQLYLHTYAVLPEYRDQGLEQALLHYNERCLRVLAEQRQQVGTPVQSHRLVWPVYVQDSETATIALLEREGYQPVRYIFDMLCASLEELPAALLPVDFQLRPIEPDHYPALYVAYKEAFADAFDSTPSSEEDYQRWIKRPGLQFPELGQVVWQADQIAGMVLCSLKQEQNARTGRQCGWVEHVCVRPAWRGRGLATVLLVQALTALRERGMTEARLVVDTQNAHGALRLYEKIGFRPIRRRALYDKPLE